jgi:hypothetical protein
VGGPAGDPVAWCAALAVDEGGVVVVGVPGEVLFGVNGFHAATSQTLSRYRNAAAACWGHTPLPTIRSWLLREMSMAGSVTQPSGQPMSQELNSAASLGLPFLFGSVGAGAGLVNDSQRVIAGAYLPHCACLLSRP